MGISEVDLEDPLGPVVNFLTTRILASFLSQLSILKSKIAIL